jgi:hypothetical protein
MAPLTSSGWVIGPICPSSSNSTSEDARFSGQQVDERAPLPGGAGVRVHAYDTRTRPGLVKEWFGLAYRGALSGCGQFHSREGYAADVTGKCPGV